MANIEPIIIAKKEKIMPSMPEIFGDIDLDAVLTPKIPQMSAATAIIIEKTPVQQIIAATILKINEAILRPLPVFSGNNFSNS